MSNFHQKLIYLCWFPKQVVSNSFLNLFHLDIAIGYFSWSLPLGLTKRFQTLHFIDIFCWFQKQMVSNRFSNWFRWVIVIRYIESTVHRVNNTLKTVNTFSQHCRYTQHSQQTQQSLYNQNSQYTQYRWYSQYSQYKWI